ncbi:MAG TPA: NAD(P)-binding domain-containing protein [Streptosporangiaceae bacterium]|jgi:thioredoxin reductase
MSDAVDVAIVGAGPYGLSLAAHLRGAGISYRQFGLPMRLWRGMMPAGMYLKSQGNASNLSDPRGTHTLAAYCKLTGQPYADVGLPVALSTFVSYAQWFRAELLPAAEEVLVTSIAPDHGGFTLSLASAEQVRARNVVVAAGVEHFAHLPEPFASLPSWACTHASAHTDLAAFAGQQVVVVGAGQSALETAALLHEHGAGVQVLARRAVVAWNGQPLTSDRPLLQRIREPESGLGSGLGTWFYSNHPDLFRRLPRSTRVRKARTALGPAGASWLRSRIEGTVPVHTGQQVTWAKADDGVLRLGVAGPDGTASELAADHLIAGTGYRTDLTRLPFLGAELRSRLRTLAGSPVVDAGYQTPVPGLYFIGPAVAPTMGPVMRFVFGSAHAAQRVTRQLAARAGQRSQPAAVPAGR